MLEKIAVNKKKFTLLFTPTKKHLQILFRKCLIIKSPLPGSNQRPTDYKSVALPAELRRRIHFNISHLIRCALLKSDCKSMFTELIYKLIRGYFRIKYCLSSAIAPLGFLIDPSPCQSLPEIPL